MSRCTCDVCSSPTPKEWVEKLIAPKCGSWSNYRIASINLEGDAALADMFDPKLAELFWDLAKAHELIEEHIKRRLKRPGKRYTRKWGKKT